MTRLFVGICNKMQNFDGAIQVNDYATTEVKRAFQPRRSDWSDASIKCTLWAYDRLDRLAVGWTRHTDDIQGDTQNPAVLVAPDEGYPQSILLMRCLQIALSMCERLYQHYIV